MNKIVQIKSVATKGPNGPTTAMLIAVNVDADVNVVEFVEEIVEQFRLHRTVAPADTTMLLISIIGDLAADRFAACWRDAIERDMIARAYMSLMSVADVIQGTATGKELSRSGLAL